MFALRQLNATRAWCAGAPTARHAPVPSAPVTVHHSSHWFAAIDEQLQVVAGPSWWKTMPYTHAIALPEPVAIVHVTAAAYWAIGESGRLYYATVKYATWPKPATPIPLLEPAVALDSYGCDPVVVGSMGRLYLIELEAARAASRMAGRGTVSRYSCTVTRATIPSFIIIPTPAPVRRARYFLTKLVVLASDGTLSSSVGQPNATMLVPVPLPEPAYDLMASEDVTTLYARLADTVPEDAGTPTPRYMVLTSFWIRKSITEQTSPALGVVEHLPPPLLSFPEVTGQRIIDGTANTMLNRTRKTAVMRAADG